MTDKGSGTFMEQEIAVAETPEHADAGQAGITGGSKIDITVADVDGQPILL